MSSHAWVPVGLSEGLLPGAVRSTHMAGEDVALWRQRSGAAHAWPNRCPHRGMRLSFGCVRDDHLACIYHGFRFGADGACTHVPAQPDFVPAGIAVDPHACAERGGFIWAAPGPGPAVEPPVADATGVPVATLGVDAAAERVTERLAGLVFPPARLPTIGALTVARRGAGRVRWTDSHGTVAELDYRDSRPAPCLLVVTVSGDAWQERLVVAVQSLGDDRCAIHVRAAVEDVTRPVVQHHYQRIAERLRRSLEHRDGQRPGWSPLQ